MMQHLSDEIIREEVLADGGNELWGSLAAVYKNKMAFKMPSVHGGRHGDPQTETRLNHRRSLVPYENSQVRPERLGIRMLKHKHRPMYIQELKTAPSLENSSV